MIQATIVYTTKGKQFNDLKDAIDHRENLIDQFLIKCPGYYDMPLKSRSAFMQSILDNRKELRDLLNYDDTPEDHT